MNEFWNQALDTLKDKMNLTTDVELSSWLGMSKQMINQIRKGQRKPPPHLVFTIIDKTGYAISRDLLFSLLPDQLSEGLRKIDNDRTKKKAQKIEQK